MMHIPIKTHIAAAGIALLSCGIYPAQASEWAPAASERLMRLPGDSLQKAVENDFRRSPLAEDLSDIDQQISYKQMTLGDLQTAVDRADTEDLRTDLKLQFLEAKRDYLTLMKNGQELRRKRSLTKIRLYERLFEKLGAEKRSLSPQQSALIDQQKQARSRMEATSSALDDRLLTSVAAGSSRYSTEYQKNVGAIQSLMTAIQSHPMNENPSIDGLPVTRDEYLRNLIAEAQGELALVNQEAEILGHMAKLVSLDALALAEGIEETETADAYSMQPEGPKQVSELVDIFTTR